MLKVGDLTQNQSNSIFSDSGSIKLTPVVSAEWNQNIFNPPYLTVSGNASTTGITVGTPTGATVTNITDQALVKPNFTTKSIITASGTVSVKYPITANSKKAYKIVFFAKTNNVMPLMLSAYGDGDVNGSSSVEINSFGWTKIETYVGSTSDISSFDYVITGNRMSTDDTEHTIYFSVPQVYETTYSDYQYHSIYPTDMVFTNFRPGESYVNTGNNNYIFPTNFRRIQNQILSTETLSGGYYGNKYMPITSVINNPSFTLATVPVPVYKNILVSDMSQYKYFVSDLASNGNPKISAIYETAVYSNKIVIKFNALMAVPNINLIIDGTTQTVDGSTTITPDDNGLLVLYWTGTAWSKTTKWSTMPTFNTNGVLTTYTTISKITIEQIGKTVRSSFTSYQSASTYVSDDLTRMQIIEVSPRLEIDLSEYVENVSINKSLDSSNSVIPISSINSNDASIILSNIPIDKANLYVPLFSSQSNLNETILKNILRKNIKFYINFKLESYSIESSHSFTTSGKFIPAGVFYSDSWEENDLDKVTVQAYDISRYLQSTPVPDYVANLKNVFEIITNILDLSGYTDYDYDSLYNICNSKTMPLDLAYYYCNSKDQTVIGALSELFLAYQIGAYIDEYGVMKFLSLSNILGSSTSEIALTDNDITNGGYSISNNAKPGKISLRYQPPKVKQSPAIQNATDPNYQNSSSFVYTTSNDVVWSQQNVDSVGYNYLSNNFLKDENKFETNVPTKYDIFHTYNLDSNNFAAIEDEIVSFAYKEYTISNSVGSVTVAVKNYIELQSEINRFIKKYAGELRLSDGTVPYTGYDPNDPQNGGYDVIITPTGNITNVQRGLFGTKIKDHTLVSEDIADKGLSQASCSSSYVITTGTETAVPDTTLYNIPITPTLNTKTLIYPTTDRDTGYKTYLTKFQFEETDVSSSGLFFNLASTSSTNNTYFLELTRYALSQDSLGNNIYEYVLALYYINSGTETIIAWLDATTTVNKILSNLPQVFVPSGANSYKKTVDESFNLRLSHYSSQTGDGEDVGELISVFLNNVEIVGWKVPTGGSLLTANITNVEADSSMTLKFTANNTFSVGDKVRISGVDPEEYNITSEILSCTPTYFKTYGLYNSAYVSGGVATQIDSLAASIWKTTDVNTVTKLFKKICLPTSISSNTIYGHFSSTKSIASTMKLLDNYTLIPESTTSLCSFLYEIYACEKSLKQRSINYYFQDREFLNGLVQGYNLSNIKSFMMQTKPAVSGINYYDVQYTNPAAVSVDVLPVEYLFQYFPGNLPGDQKWFQQLYVDEHALSYSTPINTGFRARMAIANSVPYLVFLNKDSDSTQQVTVRLNLWTHEIIAPSDQEIIEKVIDYSNISEVAQVDSEWIQSKEAAYKTLGVIEKSIDGFSKTVSLNIFGNPLIQVGDIITLTYTKNGINQQRYVVKEVSHSFEQGLNTTLSLNQLSTGTAYSIPNANTTIAISPSISSLELSSSQQFSAIAYDQYGNPLATQPTFTWSTNNGSVSSGGLYQSSGSTGNVEVRAVAGLISGSTEFSVTPTIYTVTYDEQGGSSVNNSDYTIGSGITLPVSTRSGYSLSGWYNAPQYFNSQHFLIRQGDKALSPYQPKKAIQWTTGTLPSGFNSSSNKLISYGNGIFVVVDTETNKCATSVDGASWTSGTTTQSSWSSIAYGNGKFVIVKPNYSAYSTDGLNWTQGSFPDTSVFNMVYGNGKFVAAGHSGTGTALNAISTDGSTWTTDTSVNIYQIDFYNNKFLSVAYDSNIQETVFLSSTNGTTWTSNIMPTGNWLGIQYGNGLYSTRDNGNNSAYSSDGVSWIVNDAPQSYGSGYLRRSGIFADGLFTFFEVSSSTKSIHYSVDGINWNVSYTGSEFSGYPSIAYGNGKFIIPQINYSNLSILIGTPAYDQTLYARWNLAGNITYNANSGTGEVPVSIPGPELIIVNPNDYKVDTTGQYTLHKDGYTFIGWNTQANGSGTTYLPGDIITTLSSNITLYAQWQVSTSIQSSLIDYEDVVNQEYPSDTNTPQVIPYGLYESAWYNDGSIIYPFLVWSSEQSHSSTHSLKIDWNGSYNGGLMGDTAYISDVSSNPSQIIEKIIASVWVYVPTGSPDVMLICGYDGEAGNRVYGQNNQYVSTSLKDQWVNLVLDVKNYQIEDLIRYNQTAIQVQPVYPSNTGTVYVDDVQVSIYATDFI